MANIREFEITDYGTYTLVESSPTGRELITIFGDFVGGTITAQLQLQQVLFDGTVSSPFNIVDGEFTDQAAVELAVGKGQRVLLEITGTAATPLSLTAVASVIN